MLKPLGDRVIVERHEEESQTVGGIVLANNAKEKSQTGTIVAVGPGKTLNNGKLLAPSVKKGDKVLFDKYAGTSVKYDGKSYLVLHDKDLVAVVD